MVEQIRDMPAGTLGFTVHGQLGANDYATTIVPDVEAAFQLNTKLRLLFVIAQDFTGIDPGAMWDDAKLGMRHFLGWERAALVCDVPWLRSLAHATGFLVPAEFRLFRLSELAEARRWVCDGLTR